MAVLFFSRALSIPEIGRLKPVLRSEAGVFFEKYREYFDSNECLVAKSDVHWLDSSLRNYSDQNGNAMGYSRIGLMDSRLRKYYDPLNQLIGVSKQAFFDSSRVDYFNADGVQICSSRKGVLLTKSRTYDY